MRATIFQTLQRSSPEYNERAGSRNTGGINPGDRGAGFIYTPVHSLGERLAILDFQYKERAEREQIPFDGSDV